MQRALQHRQLALPAETQQALQQLAVSRRCAAGA
jgi:hypothetical protein